MKESTAKLTKTPFYSSQGQVWSTRQMGSGEGHAEPSGVSFDWELDMGLCPVRSSSLGAKMESLCHDQDTEVGTRARKTLGQ